MEGTNDPLGGECGSLQTWSISQTLQGVSKLISSLMLLRQGSRFLPESPVTWRGHCFSSSPKDNCDPRQKVTRATQLKGNKLRVRHQDCTAEQPGSRWQLARKWMTHSLSPQLVPLSAHQGRHPEVQGECPGSLTRGGMWPRCIWPTMTCCCGEGMLPTLKVSGPLEPERITAGSATEPCSTFPVRLNCCCRMVDLWGTGIWSL